MSRCYGCSQENCGNKTVCGCECHVEVLQTGTGPVPKPVAPDPRVRGRSHGHRKPDAVNHPAHYGGADDPYEVIKVAEAWGLDRDAYLFNTIKYVARAGKKDATKRVEDLEKALFYLKRRIASLKKET